MYSHIKILDYNGKFINSWVWKIIIDIQKISKKFIYKFS